MKRIIAIVAVLLLLMSSLASCAQTASSKTEYTFGSVQKQAGADGSGYAKIFDEMYGIVGNVQNIAMLDTSTGKTRAIHVWETKDGGKVACDSNGNYVYTSEAVSEDAIALALMNH